jgi:aromatic ring-opening dioxygenase LigB subunit
MPLVYACIAPHGGEIIAELATKWTVGKFSKTREGMRRVARQVALSRPDTIIIASPHNLRLWRNIGVVTAANSTGHLIASLRNPRSVKVKAKCDIEIAKTLLKRAEGRNLPVVGVNYGSDEGTTSDLPMDWGTLIPLWFIFRACKRKPRIVIVTPSREIPLKENHAFGRVIADLALKNKSKRIVFVASSDQAHAHMKSSSFGFNKAAKIYDSFILHALETNNLQSIVKVKQRIVVGAKPDSLWQMTILAGIASKIPMRPRVYSYQVPTYYGMICAGFQIIRRADSRLLPEVEDAPSFAHL